MPNLADRVTEPSSPAQYSLPGMVVTNRRFSVPLDHANPNGEQVSVFARELVARERVGADLPYLVYFQGGPGGTSPRPTGRSGWIGRALEQFRVLLLDQRGTGLSTPVTAETVTARGDAAAQAEYLSLFRADAIVADAELIRRELVGDGQWSILGQSFGGFCVLTYLSKAPEALASALITGGIPNVTGSAEDVYRATYPRVERQNREFFRRCPHAQELARRVAKRLLEGEAFLPNGQRLTVEQFQLVGNALGATGGFEGLMDLLERAFVTIGGREELSSTFLYGVQDRLGFLLTSPIFSILHEAIYCQDAPNNRVSGWAAHRVRAEFPQFDFAPGKEFLFTGEMIYPWHFEQLATLQPLKDAAEILAAKSDWPALYDVEALTRNEVPTAAALYYHDMYVDLELAMETVKRVQNLEVWVTSEYEHSGLRVDGERILSRLLGMLPLVVS